MYVTCRTLLLLPRPPQLSQARELKPSARPVAALDDDSVIVSPADCRVVAFPTLAVAAQIWVKGEPGAGMGLDVGSPLIVGSLIVQVPSSPWQSCSGLVVRASRRCLMEARSSSLAWRPRTSTGGVSPASWQGGALGASHTPCTFSLGADVPVAATLGAIAHIDGALYPLVPDAVHAAAPTG